MTAEEHEQAAVRLAGAGDAPAFARLLHAFNVEFGASTPDAESAGFTNREGGAEGPSLLYYERDL